MLQRKILSLSNLSLFEKETIFSQKIISEKKNYCYGFMPGNFQVICGSMLNLNWNPWLPTVLEIYCDRLKLVITGHFLFYSQKSWSYDVCFLRYGARQTLFFIIMGLFLHFYPAIDPEKLKYRKNVRSEVWNEDCMMYGSWDIKDDGQSFLSFYGHFLPFDLHNTPKNQNFEKMKIKKNTHTWTHYHFALVSHKWQSYNAWFVRYGAQQTCFVILDYFLPYYPNNNPKNENFEIMKKLPGEMIILHKSTKNHNYMLHCSWDKVHDRCNCYFSFWAIFALLHP